MRSFVCLLVVTLSFLKMEGQECIIKPCVGVGNIVAGKSTLDDVIKDIGPNKISKKWIKPIEVEIVGHFDYLVQYQSLGCSFSTYRSGRRKVVEIITIDSTSKCKTQEGIGIGSSYEEVKKQLGQPYTNLKYKRGSKAPFMHFASFQQGRYETIITYKNTMTITLNNADTSKCLVSKIEIFGEPPK